MPHVEQETRTPERMHKRLKEGLVFGKNMVDGAKVDREKVKYFAVEVNNMLTWVSYLSADTRGDTVVLFIPGNPGIIEFYDEFLQTLHVHYRVPVIGVSHCGHTIIHSNKNLLNRMLHEKYPNLTYTDEHMFTMEDQIAHKEQFIKQHIAPEKKIIVVAHSMGSYVSLNVLKRMQTLERISQVCLLFPVFEHIMETMGGQKWVPLLENLEKHTLRATHLTDAMPKTKKKIIRNIAKKRARESATKSTKRAFEVGISSLFTKNALKNLVFTTQELSKVEDIVNIEETISELGDRIMFFYGATDQWTPHSFYRLTKQKYPQADVRLDDEGHEHPFIFHSSKRIAYIVGEAINELEKKRKQDEEKLKGNQIKKEITVWI